ncbi:MAG: DUF362 domain-containing protein [Planctomycetota bacterium]|nr:DUF362 domain-containing protein [Planctomycetota bacterium]
MESRVAVLATTPETVLSDTARAMKLAGAQDVLDPKVDTLLKLNLSWTRFFPACSTWPWQLDGVIAALLEQGHSAEGLLPVENATVVTDPVKGAKLNLWESVLARHGLVYRPLTDETWEKRKFESLEVLPRIFPDGIEVPSLFEGRQIVHLPTLKTHGHTVTTGAVKNSFGGLLREERHHCHKHIHEVLVELLVIQKALHPAQFSVVDGSVAGDGAGPRTMVPRERNRLFAGADPVAVDAVGAALMGIDPMSVPYLSLAHERELGCADLDHIKISGDGIDSPATSFGAKRSLVILGDQWLRKGPLRALEPFLLHGPLFAWAPFASNFYHDLLWYPFVGKPRIARFKRSEWGQLWMQYHRLATEAAGG